VGSPELGTRRRQVRTTRSASAAAMVRHNYYILITHFTLHEVQVN